MADGGVGARDHPGRELGIGHKLPAVFNRVQFRALGQELHDRDVARHDKVLREVPAGPGDQPHTVFTRRHPGREFQQMQTHRLLVAPGLYELGRLFRRPTDRTENVGLRRRSTLTVDQAVSVLLQHPIPGSLQRDAADRVSQPLPLAAVLRSGKPGAEASCLSPVGLKALLRQKVESGCSLSITDRHLSSHDYLLHTGRPFRYHIELIFQVLSGRENK